MATTDELVELRGNCSRRTVDMLDAVSSARRITRIELVNRILNKWAKEQWHEANVVHRVTRGNPAPPESGWSDLE